jgi:exodeoxyribonuclease VII large subunit
LKDDRAQIRAVAFRMTARMLRFKLEDGVVIRVGELYEVKGEYQVTCDAVEPQGLGPFRRPSRTSSGGSGRRPFDAARKRPLPALPRRIGVVTSIDGAALRDILRAHGPPSASAGRGARARVQGEGAADDLIRPSRDRPRAGSGRGARRRAAGRRRICGRSTMNVWRAIVAPRARHRCRYEVGFHDRRLQADVRAATLSNAAELVVERADHVSARTAAERRPQACLELRLDRRRQRNACACGSSTGRPSS